MGSVGIKSKSGSMSDPYVNRGGHSERRAYGWICLVGAALLWPCWSASAAGPLPVVPTSAVCGTFSGAIFRFPHDYSFLFAEYEGKSVWAGGVAHNKRGCTAKFTSVPLRVLWPSMASASELGVYSVDPRALQIDLKVGDIGADYDALQWVVAERERHKGSDTQKINYDATLKLFHSRSIVTVGDNFRQTRDLYWSADDLRTARAVMDCRDYPTAPAMCELEWAKTEMLVRTRFDKSHLPEWKAIQTKVDTFINSHKIDGVGPDADKSEPFDKAVPAVDPVADKITLTTMVTAEAAIGNHISEETQAKILKDLAGAYLGELAKQFRTGKKVTRDVDYKESWIFHGSIFKSYGLQYRR